MTRITLLCALLLLPGPIHAANAAPLPALKVATGVVAKCAIRSILGLQSAGGIDKRLTFLRRQLTKPPFSAYKRLTLLEEKEIEIPQTAMKHVVLPNGKILKLTFKERLLGRKDRLKLRFHLSITPPKETRFLPGTIFTISNHGTLLVAGDKFRDGTLVVAMTCQVK